MSNIREQSITGLPQSPASSPADEPPNPAQDVITFVDAATKVVSAPVDMLNQGVASLTNGISNALPSFPAARTLIDLVFGWPHSHPHPPSFGTPLPSIGPVLLAGSINVLINGLPAARCGDIGFGAWCGGYFPMFEVFTGSSNTFIGGARASRMLIDFTRHCSLPFMGKNLGKGLGAMDKVMMGVTAGMGLLGVAAQVTESANQADEAETAEADDDAEVAAAASAASSAAALGAALTAAQTAADLATLAISVGMGKDPGLPPLLCFGTILTGSHNVRIGGLPIPGWTHALAGLGKLLRRLRYKGKHRYKPKHAKQNNGCGNAGEPIEIVTGSNQDQFSDYSHNDSAFIWRRWYDSQLINLDRMGWGFRHEYQHQLYFNQSNSEYKYLDNKGNSFVFPPFLTTAAFEYVSANGFRLTRLSEKTFSITSFDLPYLEFEFENLTDPARLVLHRNNRDNLTFEYDDDGRLIVIQTSQSSRMELLYNYGGGVSELHCVSDAGKNICIAKYNYDDNSRLTSFLDHQGNTAFYEYDSSHRMIRKTDRNGYSFHYKYDDSGRCVYTTGDDGLYEINFEYHPEQRLTIVKYSDGGNWIYEYNQFNTITRIIDPYAGEKRRIVDPQSGLVTREIDSVGNNTELLYDDNGAHTGRLDQFGNWFPSLDTVPNPKNPFALKLPETPHEWEFGRLFFDNGFPRPSYDHVEFDSEGNTILGNDADGSIYRNEYSSWNLLRRQIDPLGNTFAFNYSPTEQVTRVKDAGGGIVEFVYDKKDRASEVRINGEVFDRYHYDDADRIIAKYDGNERLLFTSEPGKGMLENSLRFSDGEHYSYQYNDKGNVVEAHSRQHSISCEYDKHGRLTKDISNGIGVQHEFDKNGLVSSTFFSRFKVLYGKESHETLYITDPTGGLHCIRAREFEDHIIKELDSGTIEYVSQNAHGRFTSKVIESINGNKTTRSYKYSLSGDLLRVVDSSADTIDFQYDQSHRLKIANYDDGRTSIFAHNAAGNLVTQPGMYDVKLDGGNRILQTNNERFQYDNRGNVISRLSALAKTTYEYDSFDQLRRCVINDKVWSAEYDALGRRVSKSWLGHTTKYFWDGQRLAGEIRPDGELRIYIYTDEIALVPFLYIDYSNVNADPKSGKLKYLFTNHLGAPIRVEDRTGNVIWTGEVLPYGEIRTLKGNPAEINLRFPGHYFDTETGLHYNRFRYYDPQLGRYLQPDPLGIAGGYNLYAYSTNPLTEVDLRGLHPHQPNRSQSADSSPSRPRTHTRLTPEERASIRSGDVSPLTNRLPEPFSVGRYGDMTNARNKVNRYLRAAGYRETIIDANGKKTHRFTDSYYKNVSPEQRQALESRLNLEYDHQPSYKSMEVAATRENGGEDLTPGTKNDIKNNGDAAAVPQDVHKAGPTYGNKNQAVGEDGKTLPERDADNLPGAARRDSDSMVENATSHDQEQARKAADDINNRAENKWPDNSQ